MKKSIKQIALSVLLAIAAVVFCIFGGSFFRSSGDYADAAATTTAISAKLTSDKDMIGPGETFTITLKLVSTDSSPWSSFDFYFSEINENDQGAPTNASYLSYVKHDAILMDEEEGNPSLKSLGWMDSTPKNYIEGTGSAANMQKSGVHISMSRSESDPIPSTTPILITFTLKVSESAGSLGSLTFGIGKAAFNAANITTAAGSTSQKFSTMGCNKLELKLGTISKDATLKSLKAGHGSATDVIATNDTNPIAATLTYTDAKENKSDFKLRPELNDKGATMVYGVSDSSAPTPATAYTANSDISVDMSKGKAYVAFLITAEDEATTQRYDLTITSSFARLSGIVVDVKRPTGADSVSGTTITNFDQDTFTYTVVVPSDYTQVLVKPSILVNQGSTGVAVAATNCSATPSTVASGSNVTVTDVKKNSSIKLTVTAADGTTTKDYTVNFDYKNSDATITALTMTEDKTGNPAETVSGGDFAFKLSEESGFQGTFNVTLGATTSTLTIDGSAYNASTKYGAKTYTFLVTAEAGNTKSYTVIVQKDLKAGSIKTLEYAVGSDSGYATVTTSLDPTQSNTYIGTINVDITANAPTQFIYFKATPSAGATVTPGSSLTTMTQNEKWRASLTAHGQTTYSFVATSTEGSTTYKITVNYFELKNTITDITIQGAGTNGNKVTPSDYSFNVGTDTYNLKVPFTGYNTIDLGATTDGKYTTVVYELNGGAPVDFMSSTTANTHTKTGISLAAGSTTIISVYGWADLKLGEKSAKIYTFNITRDLADPGALLESLEVTVDGTVASFLEGSFNPSTDKWSIEIPSTGATTAQLVIKAKTANPGAKVKIGSNSQVLHEATANVTFSFSSGTANYDIVVTSEDGLHSTTYSVRVSKVVPDPEFKTLEISYVNTGNYTSVFSAYEYDANTCTYTVEKSTTDLRPGTDKVYIRGTLSTDASVTIGAGLGSAGTNAWQATPAHGENTYTFTVKAGTKPDKVYTIVIKVLEKKNTIENVTFNSSVTNSDGSAYSFSTGNYYYAIKVPYKTGASVNTNVTMTVTTDGTYTIVVEPNNGDATLTSTSNGTTHTKTISLSAGNTVSVTIQAIADGDKVNGERNPNTYTFDITRADADREARLDTFEVVIDGEAIYSFDDVAFDPDTYTYNYTIPYTGKSTAQIVISATAKSDKATIAGSSGTTFNATTGTGTQTYTFPTKTDTKTYVLVVTPESGTPDKIEYKLNIIRTIAKGDFSDVEISPVNTNDYVSVFGMLEGGDGSSTTNAKTYTQTYTLTDVPENSKFYIKPTVSNADTTIVSGTSGWTYSSSTGAISGSLKFGTNKIDFQAKSNGGTTYYSITVELVEGLNDITKIEILNGTTALSDFTFSQGTDYYSINVASSVSSVTIRVTPEGKYETINSSEGAFTKSTNYYQKTNIAIPAGGSKQITIYGVADNGKGEEGMNYVIEITRDPVDDTVLLDNLVVSIDGNEMPLLDAFGNEVTFDPYTNDYVVEFEKTGTSASVLIKPTAQSPSATITGVTSSAQNFTFNASAEAEKKYTITVKAPSGDTNVYTVTVKRIIKPGDFDPLEFSASGNNYESVKDSMYFDYDTNTYTLDLSLDTTSVGAQVKFRATPTNGATVTVSTNVTKPTGTSNVYTAKLAHGENIYTFTAKSSKDSTTYTFVINLYEDKNTIDEISITVDKKVIDRDIFTFYQSQNTYEFTVPYTTSSLTMNVTTDGSFITIMDEEGNSFNKVNFNATKGTLKHERVVSLDEGYTTTLIFWAESDREEEGERYTFRIYREEASDDTSLKSLVVTIGGKEVEFAEGDFDPDLLDYTIQVDASPSYTVVIKGDPTASTAKVDGTGSKTFKLSSADATTTYPITVTAENGDKRTYNITISQKPVELSSNFDILRIVMNGGVVYDGVPSHYNTPVNLTVPYTTSSVSVVVTLANSVGAHEVIHGQPNDFTNGFVRLDVGENVITVYAVAEDGTNESGIECYLFSIRRSAQGDSNGPNTSIELGTQKKEFDIDTEKSLIYILDAVAFDNAKVDFRVNHENGGTYEVKRVVKDSEDFETEISTTHTGSSNNIALNYGVNVFSVTIEPIDGHTKKSVIVIVERKLPFLDSLSAIEIGALQSDFDPDRDEYNYNVAAGTDTLTLNVGIDETLRYEIQGPSNLSYGINEYKIKIFDKSASRSDEAVRTISVKVFRQKNTTFWFILACVLAALVIIMLIIMLILFRNKKHPDEPTVIVTANGNQQGQRPMYMQGGQQPMYMQQPPQDNYYLPPNDGQY